ncbi:helix-turn-helix transcriptional regulator [Streptomyces sp. NPDC096538]|uniref:helix-turn-helix domain-containing protein n=1 Tax=Streptomyces sp. NPDC096538 TaxID=3155427 RepID=UPI00332D9491
MGNTSSPSTDNPCSNPRRLSTAACSGDCCSVSRLQASHRKRQVTVPAGTHERKESIQARLHEITCAAQAIMRAIGQPGTPHNNFLEPVARIRSASEQLTSEVVLQARLSGASWEQITAPLGVTEEAAREKWSSHGNSVPNDQRSRPTEQQDSNPATQFPRVVSDSVDASSATRRNASATLGSLTRGMLDQDLGAMLNNLQRAAGLDLRTLANRCGLSSETLFRLMMGDLLPTWEYVAAITRACGADTDVMRRVWEDSTARRPNPLRSVCLTTALRFLHQCVGSPTPKAISITSGNTLDEGNIAALLTGTATAPWEDVEHLVQILDGEPPLFFPLWQAETRAHAISVPARSTSAIKGNSLPIDHHADNPADPWKISSRTFT